MFDKVTRFLRLGKRDDGPCVENGRSSWRFTSLSSRDNISSSTSWRQRTRAEDVVRSIALEIASTMFRRRLENLGAFGSDIRLYDAIANFVRFAHSSEGK